MRNFRTPTRSGRLFLALLLAVNLGLAGCDALGDLSLSVLETGAAAERPEGWESIEDASAASRLYYQFVDAGGRVRFVERLDDVPEALRANVGFLKLDAPPPLTPTDAARIREARLARSGAQGQRATAGRGPEIILYSADWCGACRKAKRFLTRNDIAFDERNVDNPRVAEELLRKTGQRGIPVIDVDGRIISGFNPQSYQELIRGA
jgi:glutaredoxin